MSNRLKVAAAFVFAILTAMPLSARAAEIDIPYERFTLENGLRVIVHEDRKAPIVAVAVWYHVGSKDEPEGKTGFAHLFEHLMFNGTENYDGEYFEPFEQVGATDMNGTTNFDRTNYFQNVPTPALELALWMESDRMGHLLGAVTQEKLDNQRGVVQNEKRQGDNQPYGTVFYRELAGLFPDEHPYSHSVIGSLEDLDAASLEDVHEWFETYYGPDNAVLVLAGDIDAETAKPLVRKYFGDIEAGPPLTKMESWVPERTVNTRETMQDRVPAARIVRDWAVPGNTAQTSSLLTIAARALASGKTSRLYKDLVYDRKLASAVRATNYQAELAGIFSIEVDVRPGQSVAEAERRLDAVMAEFLENGPTRDEMERATTGIVAGVTRGLEKVGGFGGKAVTLASGEIYSGDPVFFKTELAWIEAAERDDVRAAARRWLAEGYHQITVLPFETYDAAGDGADRSALPEVDTTPDLKFPALETATLSNGIDVVFARRDAVPVVNVAIQFDAGYAADQGGKLGTASLAMTMLDEGTKKRTALEISEEKQRLGARIGAGSSLDTSSVTLSALSENLEPSIALMADIVRNPVFDEAELERVRGIRLAGIEQEKAQPTGMALRTLPPLIYGPDHPYGIPFTGTGTAESVQSIGRADLSAFHESWIRPDNARLFVVGDTTLDAIMPMLEDAYGDWDVPGRAKGGKTVAPVERPEQGRIVLIDRPGSPQSMILAAHVAPPTGAENNIAIEAMNDIIGGSFTARINMNLREEKGWAYGARTILPDAEGQRPFIVFAPVQTDKTAESLAELVKELKAYRSDRPAESAELEKVVRRTVRGLPGNFETAGDVLGALTANARFGRPLDYHARLTGKYRALSLDDVRGAADQVVHPDSLIWVVIGDVAEIEESVRETGIAPVEVRASE